MPKYQCDCGAKYSFPETSIGKKAKCKRCDNVFTLTADDDAPIALSAEPSAPEWDMDHEVAAAATRAHQPTAATAVATAASVLPRRAGRDSFGQSILWTILFPASAQNLMTFIVIWIVLAVGSIIPFVSLLLSFWYAAFRFAVIESAAAGERGLPEVEFSREGLWDAFGDAFRWLASWVCAMAPAIAYFIYTAATGSGDMAGNLLTLVGGLSAFLPGSGADPALLVLVAAGLFFWPIIVLVITLGGFECLYRFDLIVSTVVRSFPGYAVIVMVVFGATAVEELLKGSVSSSMGPGLTGGIGSLIGTALLAHAIFMGIALYFNIVMLRAIGLYYHHFKEQFAWDWG